MALKQWQPALRDALSAASIDDGYVKAHYRAAVALEHLGRIADALRSARTAAHLDPTNKQAAELVARLTKQQASSSSTSSSGGGSSAVPQQSAKLQQQPGAANSNELTESTALAAVPASMRSISRYVPSPDGVASNVLVLMHGLGDKPHAFAGEMVCG